VKRTLLNVQAPGDDMNSPANLVSEFGHLYPGCWQAVDKIRHEYKQEPSAWPPYCFITLRHCTDIIMGDSKLNVDEVSGFTRKIGLLGTLAAWRVTQGIYRFDQTLFEELWDTPMTKIPAEILRRLPAWCIYIELPNRVFQGVFVHLDINPVNNSDNLILRFVKKETSTIDNSYEVALDLSKGDVLAGLEAMCAMTDEILRQHGRQGRKPVVPAEVLNILGNVVSLVLYLCSVNADYEKQQMPIPKRTKKGLRFFPPPASKVIEVGTRIGAILRHGRAALESEEHTEFGSSVRPHVRRAHYHHYWTGQKSSQELILKWLSPILVNAENGEIETTIHPVKV
jgi:hypothetical protein